MLSQVGPALGPALTPGPASVMAALAVGALVGCLVVPRSASDGPGPAGGVLRVLLVLVGAGAAIGVASREWVPGVSLVGGAVLLGGVGTLVGLARVRARAERVRTGAQAQVLAAVEQMAADLAVGQPPARVLEAARATCPALDGPARAGHLGGDVAGEFRAAAEVPGCGDLRLVGAAWQVAHRSGDGLARALEDTARGLRHQHRTRRVVGSELASARATARLVALLPLATWGMGQAAGGSPLTFLLGSVPGVVCLVVGIVLGGAGLGWIDQLGATASASAGLGRRGRSS